MIGDTNLYLVEEDDCLTAETGVMIAERALRGGGRGKEAMLLMLRYGKYLNLLLYIPLSVPLEQYAAFHRVNC